MKIRTLAFGLALGALFLPLTRAQIERLTLDQMMAKTDNAVLAEIVGQRVIRIDDPIDGPELYYTTLTLQGRSLEDGKPITVDVTYPGGFIDEEHGAHNSEAPSADDVKLGSTVVAFYRWSDNMGGGLAANALYASHGGLYRTVGSPTGAVVLGRGEGYAIASNKSVVNLESAIRTSVGKK